MANKVKRVTVRLSNQLGESVKFLEEATSASSPSEVVRRAITVYHRLVVEKLNGNEPQILVKDKDGESNKPIFL